MKSASDDWPRLPAFDLNEERIKKVVVQVDVKEPIKVCSDQHHGHFEPP